MIMKNTMIRPWPVVKTLNMWGLAKYCIPGSWSSSRIPTESAPPTIAPIIAKTR